MVVFGPRRTDRNSLDFLFHLTSRYLVPVLIAVSVGGELLLPTSGASGFVLRGLAWCLIFPLLRAVGFFNRAELARVGALAVRVWSAGRRG